MQNAQKPNQVGSEGVIFLTNAFSPSMLSNEEALVYMKRISSATARELIKGKQVQSFIGHPATAQALSILLQVPVETNRGMLKLSSGDMIVFSLNARLAEGQVINNIQDLEKVGYTLWFVSIRGM